ncbi:MAG: alpha/beta hydrolase [Pseudomonadota bacterium]
MTELSAARAESRWQRVAGLRLHYLEYLPAPDRSPSELRTVLLLHGGAAHAHWFDFAVTLLADRYRVLSLDLRGHGDSEWAPDGRYGYARYAADVAAFIDALGTGPVGLVGHSMGGMVALLTASRHADRVSALTVIDSKMEMSPARVATLRQIGDGGGKRFASREAFIDGFKIRPEGSHADVEVVRYMAAAACRQFDDGTWRNKFDRAVYAHREPVDGFDYWGDVAAPALLLGGRLSDRITPDLVSRIKRHCPQLEYRMIDGAGHHIPLDRPRECDAAVSAFLGRVWT